MYTPKGIGKVVYTRLLNHLGICNILVDNQYGFRGKRSTTQAAAGFMENVMSQLEQREPALGVICDVLDAFDRVDHDILCNKLETCRVKSHSVGSGLIFLV